VGTNGSNIDIHLKKFEVVAAMQARGPNAWQADYEDRYNSLAARYAVAKEKADEAQAEIRQRELLRVRAEAFFAEVEGRGPLNGFDEQLWNCTVESVTVLVGGGFRVRFKDKLEVDVLGK